jgi:prolyl 4-hydroxylase
VIKEKSADVVAQSVDADEVCTSNGQVCSVKSEKEEGTDIADASQNTADMQHQERIEPHEIDTATSKTADQNDAATKDNPANKAAENDNTSNRDSINVESEQPTNESPREEITCNDLHENCSTWASQIDPQTNLTPCTTHSAYMSIYCPVSCDTCILVEIDATLREISKSLGQEGRIQPHCSDDQFDCGTWAESGECEKNKEYMYTVCRSSCGLCSSKR